MNDEHDELEDLRAAWRRLQAPGEERDDAEAERETRECVAWAARAWNALEVPPGVDVALPGAPFARSNRFAGRPRSLRRDVALRLLPFAAAAGLLLLLEARRPLQRPASVELARAEPEAVRSPDRTPLRPVILADGSIETRSGSVRLILVPEALPAPRTGERTDGSSSPERTEPRTTMEKPR